MGRVLRRVGRVRGRAERSERGAALVEAAIILPILLVLVFGSIEYGFLFKDASTVAAAVRAGARIASAESKQPSMPVDAATAVASAISNFPHGTTDPRPVIWVYLAGPNGYPSGQSSMVCGSNCIAYQTTWDAVHNTFALSTASGSLNVSNEQVCPGTDATSWTRVGVYVQVNRATAVTSLVPAPKQLKDHAVFRAEPVQSVLCTP